MDVQHLGQAESDSTRRRSRLDVGEAVGTQAAKVQSERHGSTTIGERWTSARYRVEGPHRAHGDLEGSGGWPLPGWPVESGRRRPRRPGRARGRAARGLRVPDGIVSLLAGTAEEDRLRPRTVRGEFHDRRIARRCRVHRRPLPDRQRTVRSDPTSRYVLSRGHTDERAADGGFADIERTAGVLLPRPAGRRGGGRRRNREGGRGEGANDGRRDQRAALFAQSSARSTGAGIADRGALARMARVV